MTQKNLVLVVYIGDKDSVRPGLNIWWKGRYIWPMGIKKIKVHVGSQRELPLVPGKEEIA